MSVRSEIKFVIAIAVIMKVIIMISSMAQGTTLILVMSMFTVIVMI